MHSSKFHATQELVRFVEGEATKHEFIESMSAVTEEHASVFNLLSSMIALFCFVLQQSLTDDATALTAMAELVSGTVLDIVSYSVTTTIPYITSRTAEGAPDEEEEEEEESQHELENLENQAKEAYCRCSALAPLHCDEEPLARGHPNRLFLESYEPMLLEKFHDPELPHQNLVECVWKAMTLDEDWKITT